MRLGNMLGLRGEGEWNGPTYCPLSLHPSGEAQGGRVSDGGIKIRSWV